MGPHLIWHLLRDDDAPAVVGTPGHNTPLGNGTSFRRRHGHDLSDRDAREQSGGVTRFSGGASLPVPQRPVRSRPTMCDHRAVSTNEGLAARLYESFTAGDIDGVLALLDPDIEWELVGPHEIPYFGRFTGLDEMRTFFELLGSHLTVEQFDLDTITPTASGAVANGSERASFVKNGACYEMRWCHLMVMRDGLIVGFTDYLDTAPMLAAWNR